MFHQVTLIVHTPGRGTQNMTASVENALAQGKMTTGLCHSFVRHTRCGLMLCENASPDVRLDIEGRFFRMTPDAGLCEHRIEPHRRRIVVTLYGE